MTARIEVRIVQIALGRKKSVEETEQELASLRNDGWEFAVGGGGTAKVIADTVGFVILERKVRT